MKISVTDNFFSGEYITLDDPDFIEYIKKCFFYQKPFSVTPSYLDNGQRPGRYYFIFCVKKGKKIWQEAWTAPQYDAKSGYFKDLEVLDPIETPEKALQSFLINFNLKKSKFRGISKRWQKVDAIMPRTQVPESYKDLIERVYE